MNTIRRFQRSHMRDDYPGRLTESEFVSGADDGAGLWLLDPSRIDLLIVLDRTSPGRKTLVRMDKDAPAAIIADTLQCIAAAIDEDGRP